MAGEKYIVATAENPMQIAIRNMINPSGYSFLGNCSDAISLLRLIRSYNPDFIIVDTNIKSGEFKNVLETVDDEMLCACIIIGEHRNEETANILENSQIISFCSKPLNKEILINTVEMANINYKRMCDLDKKLREMTENYETRKLVERAKWILMERSGLTENEAYERIRKKSMDTRTPMKSIAEAIIFTYDIIK